MKKVLYVIVGLVVIVAILGIVAPSDWDVNRSTTINASEDVVMSQITNLRASNEWGPWKDYDPDMVVEYEDEEGLGARSSWSGNEDVGSGTQEITKIEKGRVEVLLSMGDMGESLAYYDLSEGEEGMDITWGLKGEMGFPYNIMGLFMNFDDQMGPDFEKGLANLKERCETIEAEANKTYRGYKITEVVLPQQPYISKRATVTMDEMSDFFGENFGALFGGAAAAGLQMAGAPAGLFYQYDMDGTEADMAAAMPVAGDENSTMEGFETVMVGGRALKIVYYGAYEECGEAHNAMDDYIKEKGLEQLTPVVEQYITDPGSEPDTSKWQTDIYYLVK